MTFGEWIARVMQERGLGQRELGELVGVGHTSIKGWTTGASTPTWHSCRQIADALGEDRAYVRRLAGYVDPDEEPVAVVDRGLREWSSLYGELQPDDRPAALRVVRALRDSGRRRGR